MRFGKWFRLASVLALLSTSTSQACIPVTPDATNAVRGTVLIGIVTAEMYPDYEAALIRDPNWKHPLSGRHIVRVTPTEAISGEILGSIDVETSCWASTPKLGDRVIVLAYQGSGDLQVVDGDPAYEKALREAAAKRKRR
jgi:hypothetical protein